MFSFVFLYFYLRFCFEFLAYTSGLVAVLPLDSARILDLVRRVETLFFFFFGVARLPGQYIAQHGHEPQNQDKLPKVVLFWSGFCWARVPDFVPVTTSQPWDAHPRPPSARSRAGIPPFLSDKSCPGMQFCFFLFFFLPP